MEARKESNELIENAVREKLQDLLNAMEGYILADPEKIISPTSIRLKTIITIADDIYMYYQQPQLIEIFNKRLDVFKKKINKLQNVTCDENLEPTEILPRLSVDFPFPAMPQALYLFHEIMATAQQEATKMYKATWLSSDLCNRLRAAVVGSELIAERLATNVYLAVFSSKLVTDDVLRSTPDYANYLRLCLKDENIFKSDRNRKTTVSFMKADSHFSAQQYYFIFCQNKDEAIEYIATNRHYVGCCLGLRFNYQLCKTDYKDLGQYVPSLSSLKTLEIFNLAKMDEPKVRNIKYDPKIDEIVITSDHKPILLNH